LMHNLIDRAGEMITAKGGLVEHVQTLTDRPLGEAVGRIETLILNLHQQAMKIRMMPIEVIADRFPRPIRDLARKEGKEVDFQVIGKEIELDRAILEALPDPLMHIFVMCLGNWAFVRPNPTRTHRRMPSRETR